MWGLETHCPAFKAVLSGLSFMLHWLLNWLSECSFTDEPVTSIIVKLDILKGLQTFRLHVMNIWWAPTGTQAASSAVWRSQQCFANIIVGLNHPSVSPHLLHPPPPPPPPPCVSTVTLNNRDRVTPVKNDDSKTAAVAEKKIPEGELLLQVSNDDVIMLLFNIRGCCGTFHIFLLIDSLKLGVSFFSVPKLYLGQWQRLRYAGQLPTRYIWQCLRRTHATTVLCVVEHSLLPSWWMKLPATNLGLH